MAKQAFISIPLDIPDVQVLTTEITRAGELMLTVERTLLMALVNSTVEDVVRKEDVSYDTAAQDVLPHATMVAARFHVARLYRDCADTLRKETRRSLRATKDKAILEEVKHTLWPFRKGSDDLEADEQARLTRLFERAPALKPAYELRQDLTTIVDTASSRDDGLRQLQAWERKVAVSGLTCFDSFLSTLATWREQIANYFIARQTSVLNVN